jgi:hypothetical protein
MILGNKCDMEDKRQVPRETGEKVCTALKIYIASFIDQSKVKVVKCVQH